MKRVASPSPNFGPRRGDARPDMVVLHYTGMASTAAALDRLCDPAAEVSAHYLIDAAGTVHTLVDENARAWHAGAGRWGTVDDVNSRSIGIELANPGPLLDLPPFGERQMAALEALLSEILARWSIPPERVIAHSDMAPGRKADPGPKLDWQRLARRNLAVGPGDVPPQEGERPFAESCAALGYDMGAGAEAVLAAFRLRFRPGAVGPESDADRALASALAQAFPVDPAVRDA